MSIQDLADQYFTYDARLQSFLTAHKRRASNAGSRATKSFSWPHKTIAPADLAKAGFFFHPLASNPDNVYCFLCHKGLDGWEEGDDPLSEHLKHSGRCGWAICAAIEAEADDYQREDPSLPTMMEARKATFAGRWPHESKKGWKCKTKQLVDAGWKYTPHPESDDMATCAYCGLALDGWEPADKPLNEHYNRAPNCPFFTLINDNSGPKKRGGKASRASKASRLSVQSVQSIATVTSDVTSISDLPAEAEDSVLTSASTATMGSKKGRAKKGTAKGRKTKAKKEEAVEIHEDEKEATPPAKATRGKKRGSDAVEDSALTVAEAPAPKRRTRGRGSNAVDSSVLSVDDTQMSDAPEKPKRKGRASTKSTRKASGSSLNSKASTASLRAAATASDDELVRQLEADLENEPVEDDKAVKATYAMFDGNPAHFDEAALDDELRELEQMKTEEEKLEVPKKGKKAGTRKASKQAAAKDEPVEEAPSLQTEKADDSVVSTGTVVESAPKKRGRPKKKSNETASEPSRPVAEPVVEPPREPTPEAPTPRQTIEEPASPSAHEATPKPSSPLRQIPPSSLAPSSAQRHPPSTPGPGSHISPAASAAQPVLSPSQSPQSSDAENQPPSSRPPTTKRVALAPVVSTPTRAFSPSRQSPSKRGVLQGARSEVKWAGIDVDVVFAALGEEKENGGGNWDGAPDGVLLGDELSKREKDMSVEDWVFYNAGLAEGKLRSECEEMVSLFEREGGKAMRVLEGLVVEY